MHGRRRAPPARPPAPRLAALARKRVHAPTTPPRLHPLPTRAQEAAARPNPEPERENVVIVVNPSLRLGPDPGRQWPPPGGLPLPQPLTISGVTPGTTAMDLGAGLTARGAPLLASPILRVAPGAGRRHLALQFVTLAGLGVAREGASPAPGGDAAANASGAYDQARAFDELAAQAAAQNGAQERPRVRALLQAGQAAAAPPAAGEAPEAGCWTLLLWSLARDMSRRARAEVFVLHCAVLLLDLCTAGTDARSHPPC